MSTESPAARARLRLLVARLALAAAVLTFVVIIASAYMRHAQVGLGCSDWPACYGRVESAEGDATPSIGVRVVRVAHRIAATSVLALVIGMLLVAWAQRPAWKREGGLALAALVVAAGLALLGVVTPGARLPAVTLGNLLGGYAMLALLAAAYATGANASRAGMANGVVEPDLSRTDSVLAAPAATLRWLALVVLVFVFAQAALGNLIGAQYTLTACPTLGECPGFAFDPFALTAALNPLRPLSIVDGRVVPPAGAATLFVMHRATGVVVGVLVLALAFRLRPSNALLSWALAALAIVAPLLGVAAILAIPSLSLTVLHNVVAAGLVAALAAVAASRTAG
jgi:heme a synthase